MDPLSSLPAEWLAFRLGRLGDVVLCTGVLERLAERYGWRFTFVTRRPWQELFDGSPCVEKVITPADADLAATGYAAFCRRLARAYRGYGLLDLHGSLRSNALSLLWPGPKRRYPKMALKRRLFLASGRRLFGRRLRDCTVPQRYYMAVDRPPPPAGELLPRIRLTDEEIRAAVNRLSGLFGPGQRPVALHPYAANALKTWPSGHWQGLTRLLDERGIPWFAMGRGSASPFAGRENDLSDRTSLRESCALLSCSRALVSGDSGPMHMGTAVGTPVVALFGPTSSEWGFYPSGPRDRVLQRSLDCRPCSLHGKSGCPRSGECLSGIPPENVLKAIEEAALSR
jgi:ADP-heptose:LPS heptosyltransferase